ncbi:hypothetical protein RYD26_03300 [Pasteurellaceae bacterium LIM206]|nr:hypothetical protein [Pasteurellaceae bacterium LIM206]
MKRVVMLVMSVFMLAACTQGKDIYFNGSEGSHSGMKYGHDTHRWGINNQ